ncbi:glycosyltransferase family 4 protein [Cytophagaceae bacterium DM2B3-1]|uniref:Glycosyltransferase family 4 protein n=1 Tax=Xanthocytophaga flava TaxID=3048013 RepID=A0ABT7CUM0_9BACT|nr:glycosyltransferase family 4 protein [Xanthocytophaga flavus]MDJ1467040.1 glycosyltransferase family 4 protein [Xanthocytophaga flavus]MDJ1497464.1 glycosyltransferase family 4 protein [Xanthocytophaga flavus]
MKILLCTNSFENVTNGPAKFANLILEINTLYPEHEIRILTEDITIPHENVYPVKVRLPRFLKLLSQFFRMFIYHNAAQKIRREFAYDVLLYNNSFIGLWSAIVSKQPTVGMINDDNNIIIGWNNFKASSMWLKRFLFRKCEKLSVRYHQHILTNSDFLTEKVIAAYGHPQKVTRLYKSIDLSKNKFQADRPFVQPIRILFVKADFRRGDLQTLTDALALLDRFTFQLTVVGPEERFKSLIESYFVGKGNLQLDWRGEQSPDNVRQLMYECDIFCVPALQEALGVANIEALACGLPVVSTIVGGIPEVLDHGKNGWLVPPGNPNELAQAIESSITFIEQRKNKVSNGESFVKRFSKYVMYQDLLAILQDVVSDHTHRDLSKKASSGS